MQISTPANPVPDSIADEAALEELLSRPTPYVIDALAKIYGDLLILGVAGKMGPTLARMAIRASQDAGMKRKVIGIARFSKPEHQTRWSNSASRRSVPICSIRRSSTRCPTRPASSTCPR